MTDDTLINFYNKKILGTADLRDNLAFSMLSREWRNRRDVAANDGVYDFKVTPLPDGNNAVKFDGFNATDGTGQRIRCDGTALFWEGIRIPPDLGVGPIFTVGLSHYILHDGVETNPRTGQAEYKQYKELDGHLALPDLVTDNGNGTITFRVDDVCGGAHDHDGRKVKMWMVDRPTGGVGPLSSDESIAFETLTVAWDGVHNTVTTTAQFGQTTVDTTPGLYYGFLIGPMVTLKSEEDQRGSAERLYIADVVAVADGNPITTVDTTDQNVISSNPGSSVIGFGEVTPSAVISGLAVTASVNLDIEMATGQAILGQKYFQKSATASLTLLDDSVSYVYLLGTNTLHGTLASVLEGAADAAFLTSNLVLAKVTTAGGAITEVVDFRRWARGRAADARMSVGSDFSVRVSDFDSLQAAMNWIRGVYNEGLTGRPVPELELLGLLQVPATVEIDFPITIRNVGNSQNQRLLWSFDGPLFKMMDGSDGSRFHGVRAVFNLAGSQTSSAFVAMDASLLAAGDVIRDVQFDSCVVESTDWNIERVFSLAGSLEDFTINNCYLYKAGLISVFITGDAGHTAKRGRITNNRIFRSDQLAGTVAIECNTTTELLIDGNKIDGHERAIIADGTITNNQITGCKYQAIIESLGTDYNMIARNRITNCMSSDVGAGNFGAIQSTSNDGVIADNILQDCDFRYGIFTSGSRVQVRGNSYSAEAGNSAAKAFGFLHTGSNSIVENNLIRATYESENGQNLLRVTGTRAHVVANKVIGNNVGGAGGMTGVSLEGGAAVCKGNSVTDLSGTGIRIKTANHNVVSGNVIAATEIGAAIYIEGSSAENIITSNIIEGLPSGAVAVKVDNLSTDNIVRDNTYSSSGTIEGNSARTRRSVITQSGIATFNATQDTITVTFDNAFPDATYEHTLSIVNNDVGVMITVQLRTKMASGFIIEPSAQFNGEVAWTATRKYNDSNVPMA